MKKRAGFTLIELLVVIAIIAMLLAILAPSLKKAKDKAKDVVCRAHAKGVGRAILIYLEDYDSRACDTHTTNGLDWTDAADNYLTTSDGSAYWGVGYVNYVETPKAFSCPSYTTSALYTSAFGKTAEQLAKLTGFGLNCFFFIDVKARAAGATGAARYTRKTSGIKAPFNFIVAQDHPEPKYEGWSAYDSPAGGDQDDMMYVRTGHSVNLRHYRPTTAGGKGGREQYYWGIFRHSKRNPALDEPAGMATRVTQIDKQPNGRSNTIFLDGHVDGIAEHTTGLVMERQYSGY
jgi:prepilin-type N-terminal cleavage/methylation domain-containing protein/prepilin-type processing-associated H-X9-DG protein